MTTNISTAGTPIGFRLTQTGLIALCVSLIVASSLLTHFLGQRSATVSAITTRPTSEIPPTPAGELPPWGELVTLDIDLEQPEEYVSFEATTDRVAAWTFTNCTLKQTREILVGSGMSSGLIESTLAAEKVEDTPKATIVRPGDEVVTAMPNEVRAKLYSTLAQWPENRYMANPYHLPSEDFSALLAGTDVPPAALELLKKLTYTQAGKRVFSDPEAVLHLIPTAEGRLHLMKMLTYQTAVLARLRLRPDTDVDKLLGYWGAMPGVRTKDLRPLLDSIKKTPEGGTISLLYFLPPFARERLYTFPLPAEAGDVKMDCHWTAMNFFNDIPDPRFQDNAYASNFIKENCYQIGKPSKVGDLVFLLNSKSEVIHSAVYIAEDLVFTKNGINFAQPWILMRIPNLREVFTQGEEPKVAYYRRKES
jgi:hypothetical protein